MARPRRAAPQPSIDPHAPPSFVRHKETGLVTPWSMMFRKTLGAFEPYYRPDTDDREVHMARVQRAMAARALRNGDPLAGMGAAYMQPMPRAFNDLGETLAIAEASAS